MTTASNNPVLASQEMRDQRRRKLYPQHVCKDAQAYILGITRWENSKRRRSIFMN